MRQSDDDQLPRVADIAPVPAGTTLRAATLIDNVNPACTRMKITTSTALKTIIPAQAGIQ